MVMSIFQSKIKKYQKFTIAKDFAKVSLNLWTKRTVPSSLKKLQKVSLF